eukprot:COSAG02_NODE_8821_length_2432_cov_2.569653_5_plen_59_part_00
MHFGNFGLTGSMHRVPDSTDGSVRRRRLDAAAHTRSTARIDGVAAGGGVEYGACCELG